MNVPTRLTNAAGEILDAIHAKRADSLLVALNYSYGIMSIVGDDDTEQNTARQQHAESYVLTLEELVREGHAQVDRIHHFLRNLPEDGRLWHGMYATI
jgi:hypothetical protein